MLSSFVEYAATGALLIAAAAVALPLAAVHFRRPAPGKDRFFGTSFAAVAVITLLIGGIFFLAGAAGTTEGASQIATALGGVLYLFVVPVAGWRLLGPKPGIPAGLTAASPLL